MRRRRPAPRVCGAVAAAACLIAVACVSATPYRRLADAGAAYADAVVTLAGAAGTLALDASSERLLQDDALANTGLASLDRVDAEDRSRLAVLDSLATHARLMRRYFTALGDLVDGRAGRRSVSALAGVATALDAAGAALRGRAVVGDTAPAKGAATVASGLLGRSLARTEVARRSPMLLRELDTHRELLEALGRAMRHDLEVLASLRGQRLVVAPLLAEEPIADADRWVADRRALLTVPLAIDGLDEAAAAASTLRDAVAAIGERRPALEELGEVAADLERIRAALAALGVGAEAGR